MHSYLFTRLLALLLLASAVNGYVIERNCSDIRSAYRTSCACNAHNTLYIDSLLTAGEIATLCGTESTCPDDLDTCNTDYATCTASLYTTQSSLDVCTEDLGFCYDDYAFCDAGSLLCSANLRHEQALMVNCTLAYNATTSALSTCSGSLATCTTNLSDTQSELALRDACLASVLSWEICYNDCYVTELSYTPCMGICGSIHSILVDTPCSLYV